MLNLEQFRATGVDCANLATVVELGHQEIIAGRIYSENCFLETDKQGAWYFTMGNCQWSGDLEECEFYLYALWYLSEHCDDIATKIAGQFAAELREDLHATQWAEMRRRNATPEYQGDVCASHDFCDANMTMAPAFESVTGHEIDLNDDAQLALWGEAWSIAKREYLTAYPPLPINSPPTPKQGLWNHV